MPNLGMNFDLRSSPGGAAHADMTAAILDFCSWADGLEGVTASVNFLEHHGSPDGYMPSPLLFAAAAAGRTKRMAISTVLLMPLYNPIRLAEELAVLDLISGGRINCLFAAGYRREEFEAYGIDLADRGRLIEEGVETLKKAWTGEPFTYRGREARVTPRPLRQPRPPILLGGSTKVAARRAAKIADGFSPSDPALMQVYRDELIKLGKEAGPPLPPSAPMSTLVAVTHDPDAVWKKVGAHCLHEINTYATWLGDAGVRAPDFYPVADAATLRESGRYLVLTPEQCVARAKSLGGTVFIAPLTGGIATDVAWDSLRLIEKEVMPSLTA